MSAERRSNKKENRKSPSKEKEIRVQRRRKRETNKTRKGTEKIKAEKQAGAPSKQQDKQRRRES